MHRRSEKHRLLKFFEPVQPPSPYSSPYASLGQSLPTRARLMQRIFRSSSLRPGRWTALLFILALLAVLLLSEPKKHRQRPPLYQPPVTDSVWSFPFRVGDVAVSDDWGRSGFKPGMAGAPSFSVSAAVKGAGTLRLSETGTCMEVTLNAEGTVPRCPDTNNLCWQTGNGSVWTSDNTTPFSPSLDGRPGEVYLYYNAQERGFFPFAKFSGSWEGVHEGSEGPSFQFSGSYPLPETSLPWLKGFIRAALLNPASLAVALSLHSTPSSGSAGLLGNGTLNAADAPPLNCSSPFSDTLSDALGASVTVSEAKPQPGSRPLLLEARGEEGGVVPGQEAGLSSEREWSVGRVLKPLMPGDSGTPSLVLTAELSPGLPGALEAPKFALIVGGNVRGLARLAVSSGTRELTLEVAATGDLFFAMEEGNEFEFNPPCGMPCEQHPLSPVLPSSLELFASPDGGTSYTHILSFSSGTWRQDAQTLALPHLGLSKARHVYRFESTDLFPAELLPAGTGLVQVLAKTTLALALCVETPGTVPGRNMFAGVLESKGPSL